MELSVSHFMQKLVSLITYLLMGILIIHPYQMTSCYIHTCVISDILISPPIFYPFILFSGIMTLHPLLLAPAVAIAFILFIPPNVCLYRTEAVASDCFSRLHGSPGGHADLARSAARS